MAEEAATAPVAEAIQAAPQEVGVKVFIGNLAFATTSDDIKSTFSSSGEILDAQVIKRGARSMGYGFVTFANQDDASKAVSSFDKTEINGRKVNVEIAKPAKSAAGGDVAEAAAGAARRPRRNPRTKRQPPADGEADAAAGEDGVDAVTEGVGKLTTDGAGRGGRKGGRGRGGRSAGARRPVGPPEGEPSKTLVFVANLPFSMDDEALKGVFQGFSVQTAHVVIRKHGYAAGRSKGFGFVDFANEDDQKRAVEQFHQKEIELADGKKRELSVKVAINAPPKAQAEEQVAATEGEKAAAGATTTA